MTVTEMNHLQVSDPQDLGVWTSVNRYMFNDTSILFESTKGISLGRELFVRHMIIIQLMHKSLVDVSHNNHPNNMNIITRFNPILGGRVNLPTPPKKCRNFKNSAPKGLNFCNI